MSTRKHSKTTGEPPDVSKPLKLAAHEAFAQIVAKGVNQSEAYRHVYPKSRKWTGRAVHGKASELSGKVSGRVQALKKLAASKTVLTVERKLEMLATRVEELYKGGLKGLMTILPDGTQILEVNETNAHLLRKATVRVETSGKGDGKSDAAFTNVEVQDWLDPLREHSKLAGDYPAEKREITGKDGKELNTAPTVILIDKRAV